MTNRRSGLLRGTMVAIVIQFGMGTDPIEAAPQMKLEGAVSAAPTSHSTASLPQTSPSLSFNVPPKVTLELKNTGDSGWGVWISVIAALVAAVGAGIAAYMTTSLQARAQTKIESDRIRADAELARHKQEHELTTEDRRLGHAREQLLQSGALSSLEIEQTAHKIVHEQKIEEAKVLHMFFEKLLSEDEHVQRLALFSISNLVDSSVIEQIASGQLVSRSNLSKLAASTVSGAATAAQNILNRGWEWATDSLVTVDARDGPKATGFFVAKTIVATMRLVDIGETVQLVLGDGGRRAEGTCVAISEETALMLVDVKPALFEFSPVSGKPMKLRSETVAQGERLTLVQYWGSDLAVRTGQVTAHDYSHVSVENSKGREFLEGLFETDISTERGLGGSPLLDSKGLVVGILMASAHDTDGVTTSYAAPASALIPLLRSVEGANSS